MSESELASARRTPWLRYTLFAVGLVLLAIAARIGYPAFRQHQLLMELRKKYKSIYTSSALGSFTTPWLKPVDNFFVTKVGISDLHSLLSDDDLQQVRQLFESTYDGPNGPADCSLHLNDSPISDAGLENLQGIRQLRTLSIKSFGRSISSRGLVHLRDLTNLRYLSLHLPVMDAGLAHLGGLKSLTVLEVVGGGITGNGLEHLRPLVNLERLRFTSGRVADAGLSHLSHFPKLTSLDLSNTQITDAGLVSLGKLTQLQRLIIGGTKVTEEGLEQLTGLTNLTTLDLTDSYVGDAGLVHLQKLPRLSDLTLAGSTSITDAGLGILTTFPALEGLDLGRTRITDKGALTLAGCTKLRSLDLSETSLSESVIRKLKSSLPHTVITYSYRKP